MSKYQEIFQDLKQQIQEGGLKTGDKLPSIRQLSQDFSCSKDTVQRALMELRHENYIYAVASSGYYVLDEEDEGEDLPLHLTHDRHQAYEDFRLCVNETLIGRENYLFNYYEQQEGLLDLRKSVQNLLLDSAVYAKLDQLVLTSGTQQALYLLSQLDFPNQKQQILVEQPTYHRMNQLLKAQNLPYRTISRTPTGIDLAELEEIFASGHIKFFYTIPRFHYPLGHSYKRAEKEAILQLAQTYQVYIVEDDYLGDFDERRELPFHYLDQDQRVLYIKSFSTSLFPALRITALILPPQLRDSFLALKALVDFDSNLIMQKSLSLYIDNLMFEKNRSAALQIQNKAQQKASKLLEQTPLSCPSFQTLDGLLLDLRQFPSVSALKHSGLPLDFFETSYLQTCPYHYAKISYDQLERSLSDLQNLLKGSKPVS